VLIVDTDFKQQIAMEKTLRKMGCDTFLAMSPSEAVERLNHINSGINRDEAGRGGPSEIFMDLVLVSSDLQSADMSVLAKRLAGAVATRRTIIAALVTVLGESGRQNLDLGKFDADFCSSDFGSVVHPPLAGMVQVAMQKPVKAASIRKALTMRVVPRDDGSFGLTPESLQEKIRMVANRAADPVGAMNTGGSSLPLAPGSTAPYVGIRLSAQDVVLRGRSLTKS
jgi:CheY-like chemotaxis protein